MRSPSSGGVDHQANCHVTHKVLFLLFAQLHGIQKQSLQGGGGSEHKGQEAGVSEGECVLLIRVINPAC